MTDMGNDDYKYVLQDLSKTIIGARYTYGELLQAERVPFKFQTIVDRLILPYADSGMTIAEHMLRMSPEDKNFRIYDNLKTKLRFFAPRPGGGFKEHTLSLKEFVAILPQWDEKSMIQEIILSNMALMGFKL